MIGNLTKIRTLQAATEPASGKPLLQSAALAWRNGESGCEVLLVTSRDTKRWVLPKGWREKGEPPYRAAEREAEEEAGIIGKTARRMLGEYAYDKRFPRGRVRRCLVAVYPVKVQRLLDQWPEISMRERRWMPLALAAASVDEPGLAALIAEFKGDAGSEPGKAPSVLAGAA